MNLHVNEHARTSNAVLHLCGPSVVKLVKTFSALLKNVVSTSSCHEDVIIKNHLSAQERSVPELRWRSGATTAKQRMQQRRSQNATILEEDHRTASAQLCWMMLMIRNGAALNIVFLAGHRDGLEAWRQLAENTSRR